MVVSKIGSLNNLGNERPKFECLVRSLVVENKIDATDLFILGDKIESSQKLLGDRERSLPNLGHTDLCQYPFEDVGNLYGI